MNVWLNTDCPALMMLSAETERPEQQAWIWWPRALSDQNVEQEPRMLSALARDDVDWQSSNRILLENEDFRDFISETTQAIAPTGRRNNWRPVFYIWYRQSCAADQGQVTGWWISWLCKNLTFN